MHSNIMVERKKTYTPSTGRVRARKKHAKVGSSGLREEIKVNLSFQTETAKQIKSNEKRPKHLYSHPLIG